MKISQVSVIVIFTVLHAHVMWSMEKWTLQEAVVRGNVAYVKKLLGTSIDVNAPDRNGWRALHWAILTKRLEIVKMLLGVSNIDVNVKNSLGMTPLHCCVKTYNNHMVQLLLDAGSDINQTDRNKETPLHYAAWQNDENMVQTILTCPRVDVSIINKWGDSPIALADSCGHERIVEILKNYMKKVECS